MDEIVALSTTSSLCKIGDEYDKNFKVKPKKVLDEETYSENVERIIVRDFFPDHQHLKDQKDYLEAEENKNYEKMRQIALKFAAGGQHGSTPSNLRCTPLPSPAAFETPLQEGKQTIPHLNRNSERETSSHTDQTEENNFGYKTKEIATTEEEGMGKKDTNAGLNKFLAKYTSEDNDSFESIMERSEKARREKHAWLYEAEKRHEETTKQILRLEDNSDKPLAIIDGPSATEVGNKDETTALPSNKEKNSRATVPIHTWEYKNKNSLMYYPEGLEPSDDDLFKKPLLIKHENTRFKEDPFKNAINRTKMAQRINENKNLAGEKIGPDGKSIIPQESPRVGGYGFVDTPSPMPGVNESPLMTWGEIESTPARLEPSSTPGPAFRFPEESERDKLTHKMVDQNTKKHRAKKQAALKQMKASVLGTPNRVGSVMSVERINTLSPAARRLVNRKFNLGTDKALKASYTPSPSQRRRIGNETPLAKTPSSLRKTPKNTPTPGRSSITDNLLNIPNKKRKAASDFF